MSAKEQETEAKRTTPGASGSGEPPATGVEKQSTTQRDKAEADDVTIGDEAQKHRDKIQHQEKAEGERR
jgi:hypothetical protein